MLDTLPASASNASSEASGESELLRCATVARDLLAEIVAEFQDHGVLLPLGTVGTLTNLSDAITKAKGGAR